MTSPLRLAFMGTPDFATAALEALADAGHDIAAVYCQPPKPAGRGQAIRKTPVHLLAEKLGIDVHTPKSLRTPEEHQTFRDLKLDVAVVAAYGLILPKSILEVPRFGCINIHGSLLPRWRGAAPIHRALLAGDSKTGITVMQMDEGLDTGAMLLKGEIPILPFTTAQTLHDAMAKLGAQLIVQTLADLKAGTLHPISQPETGVTYAVKLNREEGKIDWNKSAHEIERQIRSLNPWPGCFFMFQGESIKILKSTFVPDKTGIPGTLLDASFTVACGQDALKLDLVQRPGKNPTDGASFLRGLRLGPGTLL